MPKTGSRAKPRRRTSALARKGLEIRRQLIGPANIDEWQARYGDDVLKQIKAVDGALDKVGDLVLRNHLKDHVVTAHERGDDEAIVDELMEVLKYR